MGIKKKTWEKIETMYKKGYTIEQLVNIFKLRRDTILVITAKARRERES